MNMDKNQKNLDWEGVSAIEVAKLLLSLDPEREYFCDGKMLGKIEEEGFEPPTIGNFRLNKMLHICQMLHYAKYGEPLFFEKLRAFYHGAIVYTVYKNFFSLYRKTLKTEEIPFDNDGKELVKKIYYYFKKYSDEDLESFSHDDPAWSKTWYERQDDNDQMDNEELSSFYQKLLGHIVKEIELS